MELFDQCQFFLNLAAGASLHVASGTSIVLLKTRPSTLTQIGVDGLPFGYGIARELIAEIVQCELEARGKFKRIADGFG